MRCCINCFESSYINAVIFNNNILGNCDYCLSKDIHIYEASELNPFFNGIIDLYEIDQENGQSLDIQILLDFHKKVFTEKLIAAGNVKNLISEIIKDDISEYQDILKNPVRLRLLGEANTDDPNLSLFLSWDKFSTEIKTINRFHLNNALDLEKFKSLFKHFRKDLPKGRKFYRARICDDTTGYPIERMGNPPNESAKSGRANPNGISYLYLANDIVTTLYEVRASLLDYVAVGTFRLEENISVVNLSRSTYDVFRLAELESLEEVLIYGSFIDKLEEELSKPKRRSDSELDYLPSQYISELIKSIGFDGIEFKSSLYSDGVNLAIFNPDKFKGLEVSVYDIKDVELNYKILDK